MEGAEELEPGTLPTAMLRVSVHLRAGSADGAVAAVAALARCAGEQPDALRVACCECVDAGATAAARQALACLLNRCAAAAGGAAGDAAGPDAALRAPGYEATVFQNLLSLALEPPPVAPATAGTAEAGGAADQAESAGGAAAPVAPAASSELASLFDRLASRMRAAGGAQAFCAQHDGRHRQLEWFARTAWSAGQKAGAAGELQQAAVLLGVCGELYAALPAPTQACLHKQKVRRGWSARRRYGGRGEGTAGGATDRPPPHPSSTVDGFPTGCRRRGRGAAGAGGRGCRRRRGRRRCSSRRAEPGPLVPAAGAVGGGAAAGPAGRGGGAGDGC